MDPTECQFGCNSVTYVSSRCLLSDSSGEEKRPCLSNYLCHFNTRLPPCSDPIISVATFGRSMVYVGTMKGKIHILNMDSCDVVQVNTVCRENEPVKSLVVAGNKVYSAHGDKKVRVWHRPTRRPMSLELSTTLPTRRNYLKNLFRSANYVEIERHHKSPWFKHFDAITCSAIGFDDDLLYSGSWDKTVRVWRLGDFVCVESINAHNDAVNAIVVGGHGMLFTASADGTVKAWKREAVKGRDQCHHRLVIQLKQGKDIPASSVNDITLSSNELVLYFGTSASEIHFWTSDEKSLEINIYFRGTLKGHKCSVLCLTSVGELLCSGSADKTIRIWKRELVSGTRIHHTCLAVLEGHSSSVKCMAAAAPSWTTYSSSLSPNPSSSSPLSSYPDNNSSARSVDDDYINKEGCNCDSKMFVLYSGSLDGRLRAWCVNSNGIRSESCCSYSFK